MIKWFLSFILLMWCIIIIDLHMLNHLCIPEINSIWTWYVIILMYCWISFANILWGFLHLCSSGMIACDVFCLWCPCLILISGWWWLHKMYLEEFSFCLLFGRIWKGKIGINSLDVWFNSTGFCLLGGFWFLIKFPYY